MKRWGLLILLAYALSVTVHYHVYKKYRMESSLFSQMLYLPSGKYLKPATLGYHALFADFVYLWSIQYYGDPEFSPKMEFLSHTYEIITELDPHYVDAYQTGALFMFYEGRNPDAGLKLLNKGMEKNPNEWIIPVDAGFYCMMNLKDFAASAKYFEKASKVPGAPSQAKRILAGMQFKMGDRLQAFRLWKEIYETATKPIIKQTAYQHMHDLKVLVDLEALQKAIKEYQNRNSKLPLSVNQLVKDQLISEVPIDPDGNPYVYDPRTGEVEYAKELKIYKRYQ